MEKTIRLLAAVLGVQLLLALGLSFTGPQLSAPATETPLLGFDAEKVDRLVIEGPEAAKVALTKTDGNWRLPDAADFPADRDKIEQLLKRLRELRGGTPVATTLGAQQRFRVSDADFERRVTLRAGDQTLGILYLGTAPSLRQINARAATSDAIFAVELGAHEFPVKTDAWIDHAVLRVPRDEIVAIDVAGLHLERVPDPAPTMEATTKASAENQTVGVATDAGTGTIGGAAPRTQWRATGLAAGESLNSAAADTLAGELADIRISALLGTEEKSEYGLHKPVLSLQITRKGGAPVEYRLGKAPQGDEYTLKVSNRTQYFRLPAYSAEQLLKAARREPLLAPVIKDEDTAGTAAQSAVSERPATEPEIEP
ncbi:MAG: DUF4340 domain-containing protein [Porticoccaceae bacterium]